MSTLHGSIRRSLLGAAGSAGAALLITACSGGSLPSSAIPTAPQANLSRTPAARQMIGPAKMLQFTTLDDQADPTFNQLLGINDHGKIAGYFGSGAAGHPNQGYTLVKPYGQNDYRNENFPGSVQTQVTAINDRGDTAGFWIDAYGVNRGFVQWKGVFTSYTDPKSGRGAVNQILGLNNAGIAVGFYTDSMGINHGFELNQATGKFTPVTPPGGGNVIATAINNAGDVAGFITATSGPTNGFLKKGNSFSGLSFPQGRDTQVLGLNDADQMVGSYLDGGNVLHGFLVSNPLVRAKWTSIDDPNGIGSTVVNGLNNHRELVGFYTDAAGNTDGMLIQP